MKELIKDIGKVTLVIESLIVLNIILTDLNLWSFLVF
jgi:hypothetical protein